MLSHVKINAYNRRCGCCETSRVLLIVRKYCQINQILIFFKEQYRDTLCVHTRRKILLVEEPLYHIQKCIQIN